MNKRLLIPTMVSLLSVSLHGLTQGTPDQAAQNFTLAPGFSISTFQEGLRTPRLMEFGPDGQLYVSLMAAGQIARLPDANRDGKADKVEVVKDNLTKPHGLAWFKSGNDTWLYVAEEDKVQRFKWENGTLGAGQVIVRDVPAGGRHTSRTVHFGPDSKMYVSVGSATDKGDEPDIRRAAILRYNPDGTIPTDNPYATNADPKRRAIWAEGLRNSVDFLWMPNGELWAATHGSDEVKLKPTDPPDLQPYEELVNRVTKGAHYGWPFCIPSKLGINTANDKEIPDPTTQASNPRSFNCANATPSLFTTVAHAAPLGMELGTSANFPAEFKNSLYIALHGSWNTNNPANYRDCKIERVVLENGRPVRSEPFATVKRSQNQMCGDAWARPADIKFGPDGSMYITDDKGGRVFKVMADKG